MKEKDTYHNDSGATKLQDSMRQTPFIVPNHFFKQQEEEINHQIGLEKLLLSDFHKEKDIPTNYFATLESNIIGKINELKLKDKIDSDGFDIPQDYFNDLNSCIQSRITIESMKDKIDGDAFKVPHGYFSKLNNVILDRITEDKLKSLVEADGFESPDSYFDNLENEIQDKILINNLLDHKSANSFEVPLNYFENLESKIYKKIKEENQTPIISLKSRSKFNWLKYGAAAAILFFGIGAYLSFNNNTFLNQNNYLQSANVDLQGISDDELINYLALVSDDDSDLLDLTQIIEEKNGSSLLLESEIKDDDIEEYLNYML